MTEEQSELNVNKIYMVWNKYFLAMDALVLDGFGIPLFGR